MHFLTQINSKICTEDMIYNPETIVMNLFRRGISKYEEIKKLIYDEYRKLSNYEETMIDQ